MNYDDLYDNFNYLELKNIANGMDLKINRSKEDTAKNIIKAFREYEKYKKEKIDKYSKKCQLGNKGKEGITYLVVDKKGNEYAMKTFRKQKSSSKLRKEAELQKLASDVGISPNIIDIDTVSKYIVMEKMDKHLYSIIKKNNGILSTNHQRQIIKIYKKLDQIGVFHGDCNLLNYMMKDNKIYIIDFGMSKEITTTLVKKLGTDRPNINIMTLGFILKLKELKCSKKSYEYLIKFISEDFYQKFQL
jgi:tRNA A-37 threonylcarbamoyl transferase component Bud32